MDRTSIDLGTATRNALRSFKKAEGHSNYDEAVQALLEDTDAVETLSVNA